MSRGGWWQRAAAVAVAVNGRTTTQPPGPGRGATFCWGDCGAAHGMPRGASGERPCAGRVGETRVCTIGLGLHQAQSAWLQAAAGSGRRAAAARRVRARARRGASARTWVWPPQRPRRRRRAGPHQAAPRSRAAQSGPRSSKHPDAGQASHAARASHAHARCCPSQRSHAAAYSRPLSRRAAASRCPTPTTCRRRIRI